jgi:hypothetical protein
MASHGDERHAPVDGELGHRAVLARSAASPRRPARAQRLEVLGQRLGQQEHVALREELLARAQPADQRPDLRIGGSELVAVAALEEHPRAQVGVDALEWAGWIACRRSSGLRDVATTPRVRSATARAYQGRRTSGLPTLLRG